MDLITKEYFMGGLAGPPVRANLQLWFDGSDQSTIVLGTGIATWKDKSGNANNGTQGTGSAQPTQNIGAQNGKNSVKFISANSQVLNLASAFSLTAGYTAYLVGKRATTSSVLVTIGSGTTAQVYLPVWFSDSKIYSAGLVSRVISNVESVAAFNLICSGQNAAENLGFVRFNRSDITASQDATSNSTMTTINTIGQTTSIGFSDGEIGEYLLYSAVHSPSQIQATENYLRNKWATP